MTFPTLVQAFQRAAVANNLRHIMSTLSLDSVSTAALLRNPGDRYPGDALVRLMLTQAQNPSDRFTKLVETRLAEVNAQLQEGVQVSTIAGHYQSAYLVQPKQHLITVIPEALLQEADFRSPEALSTIVIASLAVPAEWIAKCPICDRAFVRRSTRQAVCRRTDSAGKCPCVREQSRRTRLIHKLAEAERTAREQAAVERIRYQAQRVYMRNAT